MGERYDESREFKRFKKDEKHDDPENHFPSMENIKIKNLTDLNCLLKATGIVIMERLGVIQKTEKKPKTKAIKIHGGKED